MPGSVFDRVQRLHTMEDVNRKLAERTSGKLQPEREDRPSSVPSALPVAASTPTLVWLPPERNPDGSGRQFDETRTYRVTKTIKGDTVQYFAWCDANRKLLGYHPTVDHCRQLCQEHYRCAISNSSGSCPAAPTSPTDAIPT